MPRKRTEIDLDQLAICGRAFMTQPDMAAYFGVSQPTMSRLLHREPYKTSYEQGQANTKLKLRQKQIEAALGGNVTAQIWIGKQLLGQADKIDEKVDAQVKTVTTFEAAWGGSDPD